MRTFQLIYDLEPDNCLQGASGGRSGSDDGINKLTCDDGINKLTFSLKSFVYFAFCLTSEIKDWTYFKSPSTNCYNIKSSEGR